MNGIIYSTDTGVITQKDISNALKEAGINRSDIIMVHSDVSSFGKLGEIRSKEEFLEAILQAFIKVIGPEGTIIVPTYTYSFCKDRLFDVNKSKSEVGIFSEYVRTKKRTIRSYDPIFSHAGIGKDVTKLLTNISSECFGENSFFDRLYRADGKIINFGKFFDITFLHYIEKAFGVNYRFNKEFYGKRIKENGRQENIKATFFVRDVPENGKKIVYNMPNLGNQLEKKKLLKRVRLGNSYILCSRAEDCFRLGLEMLKKDQYAFLEYNPYGSS